MQANAEHRTPMMMTVGSMQPCRICGHISFLSGTPQGTVWRIMAGMHRLDNPKCAPMPDVNGFIQDMHPKITQLTC